MYNPFVMRTILYISRWADRSSAGSFPYPLRYTEELDTISLNLLDVSHLKCWRLNGKSRLEGKRSWLWLRLLGMIFDERWRKYCYSNNLYEWDFRISNHLHLLHISTHQNIKIYRKSSSHHRLLKLWFPNAIHGFLNTTFQLSESKSCPQTPSSEPIPPHCLWIASIHAITSSRLTHRSLLFRKLLAR
jgi:hypothetical protein